MKQVFISAFKKSNLLLKMQKGYSLQGIKQRESFKISPIFSFFFDILLAIFFIINCYKNSLFQNMFVFSSWQKPRRLIKRRIRETNFYNLLSSLFFHCILWSIQYMYIDTKHIIHIVPADNEYQNTALLAHRIIIHKIYIYY